MTPHLHADISMMACELITRGWSAHYTVSRVFTAKSSNKQLGIYKQPHCVSVEVITVGMSGVSLHCKVRPLTEEQKKVWTEVCREWARDRDGCNWRHTKQHWVYWGYEKKNKVGQLSNQINFMRKQNQFALQFFEQWILICFHELVMWAELMPLTKPSSSTWLP